MYAYENDFNSVKASKPIRRTTVIKREERHSIILNRHPNFFKRDIIIMMATIIAIRNGAETGGDLFMTISENIYNENLRNDTNNKLGIKVVTVSSAKKSYKEEIRPNGAWVYSMDEKTGWIFERYDTIEDAVRRSIKLLGSMVLCDGKEIKYEAFEDNKAYYIDFDNKYKVVEL